MLYSPNDRRDRAREFLETLSVTDRLLIILSAYKSVSLNYLRTIDDERKILELVMNGEIDGLPHGEQIFYSVGSFLCNNPNAALGDVYSQMNLR